MLPPSSFLPLASLSTILSLISQRKHILMALLSLEAFALTLVPLYPLALSMTNEPDISSMLVFLTFSAAEASLGLACLVELIRLKGTDMIASNTTMKT